METLIQTREAGVLTLTMSRPEMRNVLNDKVKKREPFRPFAPAVLRDEAATCFDLPESLELPFMLVTVPVRAAWRERPGSRRGRCPWSCRRCPSTAVD